MTGPDGKGAQRSGPATPLIAYGLVAVLAGLLGFGAVATTLELSAPCFMAYTAPNPMRPASTATRPYVISGVDGTPLPSGPVMA